MEKEQIQAAKTLAEDWKKIKNMLVKENAFDRELFFKTFETSFRLLAPCSCRMELDKRLMNLILNIHSFGSCKTDGLELEQASAVVLTERMLNACVTGDVTYSEPVAGAYIYIFEAKEEVYLDFYHAEASLVRLVAAFNGEPM